MKLKKKLNEIVFGTDTFSGKLFDIILIVFILVSVFSIILDSVPLFHRKYNEIFTILEWFFTIAFTIEYFLRLFISDRPIKYAFSFFGIVDLISFIPTYLSLIIANTHYLLVIRVLRLLRIFRILKLMSFIKQGEIILLALKQSRNKILVFLFAVINLVIIIGAVMYVIEGEKNGFTSIPRSIYWAIVTLTTVGYGDISPKTPVGQFLASLIMIVGYAIIAVPTGIVTSQITNVSIKKSRAKVCPNCNYKDFEPDSKYCRKCGEKLEGLSR
ncbi:MAG: ion transporter [Deltaproteobacteria bacterium]|nr:ion transporter [Deltaproteobacteria bacterium]